MPSWIPRAVIFKTIDLLPFRDRVYHFIQRKIVRSTVLRADFYEIKLRDCAAHIDYYSRFGPRPLEQSRVMELGTGWHPVVPVGMFLCGCDDIITLDGTLHTEPVMVREVLSFYLEYADRGELRTILPQYRTERLDLLREIMEAERNESAFETLKRMKIELRIGDARALDMPSGSLDCILSNNTLEHIPPAVASAILDEFRRVIAPDGIMSHFIDMSDHYAHVDSSITVYNFLKFSDSRWKLIDNGIVHLNRLRVSDHREMLSRCRFRLIHEEDTISQGPEALGKVTLAPRFRKYDRADILVTHCRLISAPV